MAREGSSYGYDYNPHNIVGNVPPPTFAKELERPSHCYDCNPFHSVTNVPPPTSGIQETARDTEEEEFQQLLNEVTR
jgi:hypothetical protein